MFDIPLSMLPSGIALRTLRKQNNNTTAVKIMMMMMTTLLLMLISTVPSATGRNYVLGHSDTRISEWHVSNNRHEVHLYCHVFSGRLLGNTREFLQTTTVSHSYKMGVERNTTPRRVQDYTTEQSKHKEVKCTLQQAIMTHRSSRGIALLFL